MEAARARDMERARLNSKQAARARAFRAEPAVVGLACYAADQPRPQQACALNHTSATDT